MNTRLARLACVVVVGVLLTLIALQLPAAAKDKQPPTPPPPKSVTPTPSPKRPQVNPSKVSAPNGGGSPDYSFSTFSARGTHPGETITYQLVIKNRGTNPGAATVAQIALPANAPYVASSAQVKGGGSIIVAASSIQWTGVVTDGQSITLTFRAILPGSVGVLVQSTAVIYDPGLVAALTLKNSLTTQAASGGPDALGYTYKDSFAPGGPTYSWVPTDAASTKLVFLNGTDDGYTGPITIGFPFKFYTGTYTTTFVGTNGFLSFDAGSTAFQPLPIPTTGDLDKFIGCRWSDLLPWTWLRTTPIPRAHRPPRSCRPSCH